MDEKAILSKVQSEGTRVAVLDLLHNHRDMDYKTTLVVGELLALLESQRVIRRGNIVDFLNRACKQLD